MRDKQSNLQMVKFPKECPKCKGFICLEPWGGWTRVKCLECSWWDYYDKNTGKPISGKERMKLQKDWQ